MTPSSKLHLAFELDQRGSTILRVRTQQPPWRVVRGFRAASGETLGHLHNVSGGVLDGDRLEWRVDVGPNAWAQVTSTGATRVYRSRSQERVAEQHAIVTIGENGYFEYLPDQLIPFAGSRFEQSARIEMGSGAALLWWDIVAPGREAAGEIFRYDSLASSFEVTAAGAPVVIERWKIAPAASPVDSLARMGPFRYFASCYVCRTGQSMPYWRALEAGLQELAESSLNCGPEVTWGITSLRAHGLVARGAAVNGRVLTDGLIAIWRAAKWSVCGRVAVLPRKVY